MTSPATSLPPVSVLLPVYNPGRHLLTAVESILNQTHRDLEVVIVNDGSNDGSALLLDSLTDSRVRVVHQSNQGIVVALNRALTMATHDLVARMDADDESYPQRLAIQATYLRDRPDVGAVGCCYDLIDDGGGPLGTVHVSADPDYLRRQLMVRNVLPHGAMMMRASILTRLGGYHDEAPVEDYELWSRMAQMTSIAAIAQPLYAHRISPDGVSQTSAEVQRQGTRVIRARLRETSWESPPPAWQVARGGRRLVAAQPDCPSLPASFVFDHVDLAVDALRRGRRADAMRLLGGVMLFAATRPRALQGLSLYQGPFPTRRRRQGPRP